MIVCDKNSLINHDETNLNVYKLNQSSKSKIREIPYEKSANILRNAVHRSEVPNVCTTKDMSDIRRNIFN